MALHEIVMKLIGPVQASGDSSIDVRRLQNMEDLIELTDRLLGEILLASNAANNHQSSMKAIGKRAIDFLTEVNQGYAPPENSGEQA